MGGTKQRRPPTRLPLGLTSSCVSRLVAQHVSCCFLLPSSLCQCIHPNLLYGTNTSPAGFSSLGHVHGSSSLRKFIPSIPANCTVHPSQCIHPSQLMYTEQQTVEDERMELPHITISTKHMPCMHDAGTGVGTVPTYIPNLVWECLRWPLGKAAPRAERSAGEMSEKWHTE